ncbi:Putative dynamin-related protein 4A [Striga hermonthica]|uniref:Dynamin-related protein 4A n=1 Tax=Striga hermonthica TaxID=68872 RepID=A0A9N7MPJ9_STRHE|nr:Putative dynamin-related protein 4A [Striga hermonthica]
MAPPPSPPPPVFHDAPVFSSYNRIRPLLDTVDRLRKLNVVQEGIKLPTIVVVGDQSAGKSSVLESLAGISLPRGEGTCTRVPLIMCLRNQPNPNPELSLEFRGQTVPTDEASVTDAISRATEKIAGEGYGVSNTPLTLVVKKSNIPDLTMVDLPGFTRVPVDGQPADIYEQISSIVMDFIEQDESIILNVLSASLDLNLCDSIRMSQKVDPTGQRTLAVVTKADKDPDGLFKMVTSNKVSIGLGYFCVRNRVGDETYEEALEKEAQLFKTHHLLSGINRISTNMFWWARSLLHKATYSDESCFENLNKQNMVGNKLAPKSHIFGLRVVLRISTNIFWWAVFQKATYLGLVMLSNVES